MFGANIGKTLLYGTVVAIPAIVIAGPLFARTIKKVKATPLPEFYNPVILKEHEMPPMGISIFTALLPVLLIGLSTVLDYVLPGDFPMRNLLVFIGNPVMAMLISVLVAIYTLGLGRGKKMKDVMDTLSVSISSITMVLLIIAGAGALKQILVDSGVSDYIGEMLQGSNIPPLVLGWLIATILRVSIGSATVAGLTAAGIVLPLVSGMGVQPELMVLAIGSGSLMLSHVNDGGFWLFKEYFNLSVKETLSTWTVMETLVGVIGITGVLIMNQII
jgi:Gnt-I system high-affinity gluconate transporter